MTDTTEILFDPTDPDLRANPYPTYRTMREQSPVWRSPEGIYYFTRYADCFSLFRSPSLSYDVMSSASYQQSLSTDPEERERQLEESRKSRTVLDADPPEHTRLRSLINRTFTAPTVEASRPMITAVVDSLMDDFEGPSVDLVSRFAALLPILVICSMLGVPTEERHEFVDIGHATARTVDPDVAIEDRLAANQLLRDYIATLIDRRRERPGDDLITGLIEAAEDGRLASTDELLANTGVFLVAGFETTTNLITNAVYQLLRHPDRLAELRRHPSLIRTTVEEVLRFDPPVHMMRPRTISSETQIGGAELHPGDPVVPLLAAANRDADEFDDPETFDIRRTPNRHLGFGLGPHLCVGAPLARLETQIALLALFDRFPNLALTDDTPEFRPNFTLRGFSKLLISL